MDHELHDLIYSIIFDYPFFCVTKPHLKYLSTDDPDAIRIARRDSTCSFYQPPPPTDIQKMRNNMIKEQKVFALIREILSKKNINSLSLIERSACLTQHFTLQFMWDSFGCFSWLHMVNEIPMHTTSLGISGRVSAMAFQRV